MAKGDNKSVEVISVTHEGNFTGDMSIGLNTINKKKHVGVSVPEGTRVTFATVKGDDVQAGVADANFVMPEMPDIDAIMRKAMADVGNVSANNGEVKVGKIQTGSSTNSHVVIGDGIIAGDKSQAKELIQADEITMPWKSGSISGGSYNGAPIVGKYVPKIENGEHVMREGQYVYVRP